VELQQPFGQLGVVQALLGEEALQDRTAVRRLDVAQILVEGEAGEVVQEGLGL
jgi:hypothetical protein